jgi:CTP:molybdopterin cytidylyltransferase MocA
VNAPSAAERVRPPTFAAIIFHADKAEMLRRCIEHHLAAGVDRIFVSLHHDDAESAAVAAAHASAAVRVARVEEYAADPLDYFNASLHAVTAWAPTDWVMFVDSDEFWVPAAGTMRGVAGLEVSDASPVRRFNAPPIRSADGTLGPIDLADPAGTLVVGARQTMDAAYLAQNAGTRWIDHRVGPKLMVRPGCVGRIGFGAHDFVPVDARARVTVPDDLLIVHLPFTDEPRFRRKVEGARAMLAQHDVRLEPAQAWHWRRWLELADGGGLDAEFAAQVIDERQVAELLARGVLTTPRELFAARRLVDA